MVSRTQSEVGRALREPALVASLPEPASGLRPSGDDPARKELPRVKMFGSSEIWRDDSTGTRDFYFMFIRLIRRHFHHSTALFD